MADEVVTCGMCGAFTLASVALPYKYDGKEAVACPRCWKGVQEHSK
jgi:hypothetical protein